MDMRSLCMSSAQFVESNKINNIGASFAYRFIHTFVFTSMYTFFGVYLGSLYSTQNKSTFLCVVHINRIDARCRLCHSNLRYFPCRQGDVGGSAIRSGLATWQWELARTIWRYILFGHWVITRYLVGQLTFQSLFITMFFEICADAIKKDRQTWVMSIIRRQCRKWEWQGPPVPWFHCLSFSDCRDLESSSNSMLFLSLWAVPTGQLQP